MKKKIISLIPLILLLIGMFCARTSALACSVQPAKALEQWVPYVPSSEQVDLEFWIEDQVAYVKVCITFSDAGFGLSDWGSVTKYGCEIQVNSEIWEWTGPAAQAITTRCHTYDLGHLESEAYTFTFKAWGIPIENTGTTAIPEFTSVVSILLALAILTAALVIYKRRQLQITIQ